MTINLRVVVLAMTAAFVVVWPAQASGNEIDACPEGQSGVTIEYRDPNDYVHVWVPICIRDDDPMSP